MDARFTEEDEAFRREIAAWLDEHLRGDFEIVKGRGGPGDEHALFEERHAWERLMGQHGWIGIGFPKDTEVNFINNIPQLLFFRVRA